MYFDKDFRSKLKDLFLWRRDVRRFKTDPIDENILTDVLRQAILAPSVGYSQPWRFVRINSLQIREKIIVEYEQANEEASKIYNNEDATLYRSLKLSGMKEAPVHIAIFAEEETEHGKGIGRQTMPETIHYSVVAAIENMWLASRANGIGMGWVSIIDPQKTTDILDVPNNWRLIGYMCLGYPIEEHTDPELIRAGWEETLKLDTVLFER